VEHSSFGVTSLSGEVEIAARPPVEVGAECDQFSNAVGTFSDSDFHRFALAQAGAGEEGVLDMLLKGIVRREYRGNPPLGVLGVALISGPLGYDRNGSVLGGLVRKGQPGDPPAQDQEVKLEGHEFQGL
jgi:hypothetical protein